MIKLKDGYDKYSPDKISCVEWFDKEPTSPMEFDYIESCYDYNDWKIVKVKVIIDDTV